MRSLCTILVDAIGEASMVLLSEQFGGQRLYIPRRFSGFHALTSIIGRRAANSLSDACAPAHIRVPIARELRIRRYFAEGMTLPAMASRLGISEHSTERLLERLRKRGELASESPLRGSSGE